MKEMGKNERQTEGRKEEKMKGKGKKEAHVARKIYFGTKSSKKYN